MKLLKKLNVVVILHNILQNHEICAHICLRVVENVAIILKAHLLNKNYKE